MKKHAFRTIAFLVLLYLIAPFASGLFGYSDPRGPVIFPSRFHEVAHTIGGALAGRPETKMPLAERPLFYGLTAKPIHLDEEELQKAINQHENLNR
jgi:hypothetical protein